MKKSPYGLIPKCTCVFFLLCTSGFSRIATAGGGGSLVEGGDTILCRASTENQFEGYYTLDYLLKYKVEPTGPIKDSSFAAAVSRIGAIFKLHYPEILPLFYDFMNNVRNEKPGSHRLWIASDTGLVDIKDENIVNEIPENCTYIDHGIRKPLLFQTVIRKSFFDPIQYLFNRQILEHQEKNNILQYSFFIVHEWLRDLTRDVEVIRKINWTLHSPLLEKMTRNDFVGMFSGLGVFRVKLPLCGRSHVVQNVFAKHCDEMSLADLREVSELSFDALPENFIFRVGDLYGFSKVKKMKIKYAKGLETSLPPRFFEPLYSLTDLDLSGGDLTNLSSELTRDLDGLLNLDLTGS